ncbi:MAG: hypothetical protein AAGE90_06310 [Pseudomonadota bacterium]
MRIGEATLVGVAMAFGLARPSPDEARQRCAAHGNLAEELLASLLLTDRVLDGEDCLSARLNGIAARHRAAAQTIRESEGDLTAERLRQLDEADRLSGIVAAAAISASGGDALSDEPWATAPGHDPSIGRRNDPIDVFTSTILPERPQ